MHNSKVNLWTAWKIYISSGKTVRFRIQTVRPRDETCTNCESFKYEWVLSMNANISSYSWSVVVQIRSIPGIVTMDMTDALRKSSFKASGVSWKLLDILCASKKTLY